MPQELTNDRGDVVWLNYSLAWGGSFDKLNNVHNLDGLDVSADELQPIRFQGQFFDSETNLHYNRFRYYDSDVGMFVSRDPIELLGGINTFQYAPNPTVWIDPFGLVKSIKKRKKKAVSTTNVENNSNNCQIVPQGKNIYYHYTTESSMNAILTSKKLLPSLKASNPKDARYGDGQYLTDIVPQTKSNASLSMYFIRNRFQGKKFTNFVAIDTTGLDVTFGRNHVFVILNNKPLDLKNRIVGFGKNCPN